MRLKELRIKKGLSQKEFAHTLKIAQNTVSNYEIGKRQPDNETLVRIANYFGVTVDYLLGRDEPLTKPKKGIKIPVLGAVAAGIPIEAIEDIVDYEEIDEEMASRGEYFALRIKGQSMEPRICEGDVVIVRKQNCVDNGQLAIVMVNGYEATCKKVVCNEKGIKLLSFNPVFEPMFYTREEVVSLPVTILGQVVELRGKF